MNELNGAQMCVVIKNHVFGIRLEYTLWISMIIMTFLKIIHSTSNASASHNV